MLSDTNCLVCKSKDVSFHLTCKDYFTSSESFDILKCNNCGFLFTQNPPAESEIGRYYNTGEYISHSDTKKGLINFLFHSARNLMLLRKRNLVKMVTRKNSGTLLDIGSGTGYFPAFMKKHGWAVTGLEVNEKAREYAKEKFNLNILTEDEFRGSKPGIYDCITLWHVLEHFHDPIKYMARIKNLLKEEGICIIAIPNSDSFDAKIYGKYWAAYDVPRHLWHFNPTNFRLFSEKNGFMVDRIRSLPLDIFYISILSEKYKGSKLAFIHGLLRASPFAFLSLIRIKRSSSVIYVLRKTSD
jgi:SAM-dependent methyltransferase